MNKCIFVLFLLFLNPFPANTENSVPPPKPEMLLGKWIQKAAWMDYEPYVIKDPGTIMYFMNDD